MAINLMRPPVITNWGVFSDLESAYAWHQPAVLRPVVQYCSFRASPDCEISPADFEQMQRWPLTNPSAGED
jgi:hypothetical protein